MKKSPLFWLALVGGAGLVIVSSVILWSWGASQVFLQTNSSAQTTTDEVYAEAKMIVREVNDQLIVVEKNQQSTTTGGGFSMPLAIDGLPNKELINVIGINSPSFSIKTLATATELQTRSLSESEQTQATVDLLSINSRLLNKLLSVGFSVVDTATEASPVGSAVKTTYLKPTNNPEIICGLNVEDSTNTSGFGCVVEAEYLAKAEDIKQFIGLYRANKNLFQEPGLSFGESLNNTVGENGYEIKEISYGQARTIFYRKDGAANWTAGNVQLSYQSLSDCNELKKDPGQIAAMSGYATVDGQQKYMCYKNGGTEAIPVSPSI